MITEKVTKYFYNFFHTEKFAYIPTKFQIEEKDLIHTVTVLVS